MAEEAKTPREKALEVVEHLERLTARIRDNDSIEVIEVTMNMRRGVEQLAGMHPEQLKSDAVINYATGAETWTITAELSDVKVADENYSKGYRPAS